MSTTVSIACMECKEYLWVGQRNWIYTGEPETMQMLQGFLFKHQLWGVGAESRSTKND